MAWVLSSVQPEVVGYLVYFIINCLELQSNDNCNGNYIDPATMAEIWPNPTEIEKYNVTLFNGFNVPITIAPTLIGVPGFPGQS